MSDLLELERRYGFVLPTAYRAFSERGYLAHASPSYLWVHEAEWLSGAEMLVAGGFWGNPKPGLVAFAFTGGRDVWA